MLDVRVRREAASQWQCLRRSSHGCTCVASPVGSDASSALGTMAAEHTPTSQPDVLEQVSMGVEVRLYARESTRTSERARQILRDTPHARELMIAHESGRKTAAQGDEVHAYCEALYKGMTCDAAVDDAIGDFHHWSTIQSPLDAAMRDVAEFAEKKTRVDDTWRGCPQCFFE